jgi:hypothetical protein
MGVSAKRFTVVLRADAKGRVYVPVPFDPATVWGTRPTYHLRGTVGEHKYRGEIERFGDDDGLKLGPAWRRDCGLAAGDKVKVALEPEGPQLSGLDPDIAAALDASPKAKAFFESLAQFYRKAYLAYISATKKSPEKRVARIAEVVQLLEAGTKERPK